MELSQLDKEILEIIQEDFPLVSNPFENISQRINISHSLLIEKLKIFHKNDIIREIGPLFEAKKLGYKNTLVAVQCPESKIDIISNRINKNSGVSHNYLREHNFNIWFTLGLEKGLDRELEVAKILNDESLLFRVLPAITTYKIGVHFRFNQNKNDISKVSKNTIDYTIDNFDKKIIKIIQKPFPIIEQPFSIFAQEIGFSQEELIEKLKIYKQAGILKRISATLRHRKVGFNANGMCCFIVDDSQIDNIGKKVSEFSEVTHCYHRPKFPEWPYNLFAMVHASTKEECIDIAKNISSTVKVNEHEVLFSVKEFKKERVKYFQNYDESTI